MGKQLLNDLATATGLPENLITDELGELISRAGLDSQTLTLDDLRGVLAEYLQDILLDARETY